MARFVRVAAVACGAVTSAVACAGGGDDNQRVLTVTSQVVSDSATPDVRVLAPEDKGPWPVVVALHGLGGSSADMVELGTRLASAGAVVFAPTYHSELATAEDLVRAGDDLSCAYALARRTAAEHGGDLKQPVTAVGWSLGADFVVLGSLQEPGGATSRCPGPVPRPDVVVGLSGCYYEFQGKPVEWFDDVTSWRTTGSDVYLVDGDRDTVCPAWQTEKLAAALRGAGHDIEVVKLSAANHYAPIFHDLRNGEWQVITDDPAGEQTVQVILDAIAAARDTPRAD